MQKSKKGAMELSIGTIVILVLAMSMLILGVILVRSIMCAGIGLSGDIENKMKSEIQTLFGVGEMGVKCMGAPGADRPTLLDGGKREIICLIKEDRLTNYELKVIEVKSQDGANIESWVMPDNGWSGSVSSGETPVRIVELDIPRGVSATTLTIKMEENKDGRLVRTHDLRIDVAPAGLVSRAIC